VEADVEVRGNQGQLLVDLVEGGVHYVCRIDVASGQAQLSIDGGRGSFWGDDGPAAAQPQAATSLRGGGKHRVMLSNCDDQLLLWVDGRLAAFDGPTTFVPQPDVKPQWSSRNAGDLEPAGIGAEGVSLSVSRLRLYRDVYYVSSTFQTRTPTDYEEYFEEEDILKVFATPQAWSTTPLFDARRKYVEFALGEDQFFPLGDNSPQSRDARLWSSGDPAGLGRSPPPYVRRDLLTGKALMIYWPHSWRRPIPFFPNFQRMSLIR
jgi:signal peptidase I